MKRLIVVMVCVLAVVLAGCGGGSTASPPGRDSAGLGQELMDHYSPDYPGVTGFECVEDDQTHYVCVAHGGRIDATAFDVLWNADGTWISNPK